MRVSISNNLGVVETTYCTVLTESDAIEPPMLLDRLSAHLSASRTSTGRVKYVYASHQPVLSVYSIVLPCCFKSKVTSTVGLFLPSQIGINGLTLERRDENTTTRFRSHERFRIMSFMQVLCHMLPRGML